MTILLYVRWLDALLDLLKVVSIGRMCQPTNIYGQLEYVAAVLVRRIFARFEPKSTKLGFCDLATQMRHVSRRPMPH
jgi:hypothetical protein